MMPRIVFTGGGTAGHVTPNIALIHQLKEEGWTIDYIGSAKGVEQPMIQALDIPFHSVQSGKLRRYFSLKNLLEPFKILVGIIQTFCLLFKLKPDLVFSKGGFVAFPVVVAAFFHRIPIVAHESDMTPGLANKLSFPFVNKICLTFDAGKKHFKNPEKIVVTGTPIRHQLFAGNPLRGLQLCGFNTDKPCLLVVGGSLGASSINKSLRQALPELTQEFQIIHICGKGKIDPFLVTIQGYCQFDYVNEELADLFAAADIVISRSGANALYELLALGKPHILVPLSGKISRGDQIQNAHYFQQLGISSVIQDEALTSGVLIDAIREVALHKEQLAHKIKALNVVSATDKILAIIKEQAHVESPRAV